MAGKPRTIHTTNRVKLSPDNPGALIETARLYERMVYAYPDAPEAERWQWLSAWYYSRAAGRAIRSTGIYLEVQFLDLAVGDVLEQGKWMSVDDSTRWEIVNIAPWVSNLQPRWAYVRNLETGEIMPKVFEYSANSWGHHISGGLKVEAVARGQAQANLQKHPTSVTAHRWIPASA